MVSGGTQANVRKEGVNRDSTPNRVQSQSNTSQKSRKGFKIISSGTALVAHWLRIRLQGFPGGAVVKNPPANEGTRVRALVWEDPTCRTATKPMRHNY